MKAGFERKRIPGVRYSKRVNRIGIFAITGTAIIALFGFTGCMLPYDQFEVQDIHEVIAFEGVVMEPGKEVSIQAYLSDIDDFEEFAKATSVDSPRDAKGSDVYLWSEWLSIPEKYWMKDCASDGNYAIVRAKTSDYGLISVEEDWHHCYDQYEKFGEFLLNCGSSQSPNARIYTKDYRDFGQECVDMINALRALENLPPLTRYKDKECDADGDAKANYEGGEHVSEHGNGQNLCTRLSIDDLLYSCTKEGMYDEEKKCYDQYGNKEVCKSHDCVCGHYVNLTDKKYTFTKVACGLYKTPSGSYTMVQNFYFK